MECGHSCPLRTIGVQERFLTLWGRVGARSSYRLRWMIESLRADRNVHAPYWTGVRDVAGRDGSSKVSNYLSESSVA
jgi:hypothetical protein